MKQLQWGLGIIAALALIFALLITSFEIATYSDFGWYQKEYEKYNVTKDLNMEIDDVMDVTHEMMDYLRGKSDDLIVITTINGAKNQEFFNDRDKAHMLDVRNLFLGGLKLRNISLGLLVLCLGVMIVIKTNLKRVLPRCYQITLGLTTIGVCFTLIYAALDFNEFFTKFHEVFFTNELWIFDPRYDYMIRMLPEGFFADMSFRIVTIFVISLLVMLIVSVICDKRIGKKKITISEDRC